MGQLTTRERLQHRAGAGGAWVVAAPIICEAISTYSGLRIKARKIKELIFVIYDTKVQE
jgi:hypothetical protein